MNAEFFCPSCHVLVCLHCKMIGHHSSGEASKHSLVPVTEAYQSVLEASQIPDSLIEERQANLRANLNKIHKKGQNILCNAQHIREQIEEIYKKANADLDNITANRLLILKGDAQEYKRLLSEINRIKEYLEYLETGRDATLFLLSWHQYLQAKAEIYLLPLSGKENQNDDSLFYLSGTINIQSEPGLNSLSSFNSRQSNSSSNPNVTSITNSSSNNTNNNNGGGSNSNSAGSTPLSRMFTLNNPTSESAAEPALSKTGSKNKKENSSDFSNQAAKYNKPTNLNLSAPFYNFKDKNNFGVDNNNNNVHVKKSTSHSESSPSDIINERKLSDQEKLNVQKIFTEAVQSLDINSN